MKREIKFRAWDAEDNEMYIPMVLAIVDDATLNYRPLRRCKNGNRAYKPFHPLMQFTGLTDKNGKDIYEGDIVTVHRFIEVLGENYGVSEGELEFTAKVEIQFGAVYLNTEKIMYDNETYSDYIVCMDGLHEESIEVIGNIYENPKLLKH